MSSSNRSLIMLRDDFCLLGGISLLSSILLVIIFPLFQLIKCVTVYILWDLANKWGNMFLLHQYAYISCLHIGRGSGVILTTWTLFCLSPICFPITLFTCGFNLHIFGFLDHIFIANLFSYNPLILASQSLRFGKLST